MRSPSTAIRCPRLGKSSRYGRAPNLGRARGSRISGDRGGRRSPGRSGTLSIDTRELYHANTLTGRAAASIGSATRGAPQAIRPRGVRDLITLASLENGAVPKALDAQSWRVRRYDARTPRACPPGRACCFSGRLRAQPAGARPSSSPPKTQVHASRLSLTTPRRIVLAKTCTAVRALAAARATP